MMEQCMLRHLKSIRLSLVLFFIVLSEIPVCSSVTSKGSAGQRTGSQSAGQRNNIRPGTDGMCGACWTREERRDYDKQVFQEKILRKLRMRHPPDFSNSVKNVHLISSIQNIINELEEEDRSRRSVMSSNERHCGEGVACTTDQISTVEDDTTAKLNMNWQNERLSGDGESSTVINAFHLAENVVPNDPSVLKFDLSMYSDPDLVVSATLGVHVESMGQSRHRPYTWSSSSSRNHGSPIITLYRRVTSSIPHQPGSYQNEFIQKRRRSLRNIQNTWQTFNVTQQVLDWIRHPDTNHGLALEVLDHRRRLLNVLDLNCSNSSAQRPYLELQFMDPDSVPASLRPHSRARRTPVSEDCRDNSTNAMCCRHFLTLDFAEIGWDWVIAPQRTSAYYCSGQCSYLYQVALPATHLGRQTGQLPGAPCCAPTKTSDLQIMHLGPNGTIIQSTIPGLIIDKCGCW